MRLRALALLPLLTACSGSGGSASAPDAAEGEIGGALDTADARPADAAEASSDSPDAVTCVAFEKRCEGERALVCAESATRWLETPACDDGNECTAGDRCSDSVCVAGDPIACGDGNPCTKDSCNPLLGCVHFPDDGAYCDDGDGCTEEDTCQGGACAGGFKMCSCETDADCAPFDDGEACNGVMMCLYFQCVPDPVGAVVCETSQDTECVKNLCDPGTGACSLRPADGAPCEDGDPCTLGDTCLTGECHTGLQRSQCDDGNPCTDDECGAGGCVFKPNSAPCDDGNPCTLIDHCAGGGCTGEENACGCDSTSECGQYEDDDFCNGYLKCEDGVCVLDPTSPVYCDTSFETNCLFNVCDPATGQCGLVENIDGEACDDGSVCTVGDYCWGGVCKPGDSPYYCNDQNPCTADSCDDTEGCLHEPAADGTACDDKAACTTGDHCSAGACAGWPKICDDGNKCTDDACIPEAGGCVFYNNTKSCDDGNLCTYNDICNGGNCYGIYVICDDKNGCTEDACKPELGACVSKPVDGKACDDGDPCTLGDACLGAMCLGEPKPCDDANPCSADWCDPYYGCQHENAPDATQCDDADPCTDQDACVEGFCAGQPVICDDGDPCTMDACSSIEGCVAIPTDC